MKENVLENIDEEVIVSDDDSKKIVFDLENDFCEKSSEEKEESASEMISPIILEDKIEEKQILDLDQLNKSSEESVLNKSNSTKLTSEVMKIESREREERLRNISIQLRTPSGLTSLEDVPAYKRNNVDISKQIHSSESEASTYTLTNGDDNTTELKQNNSFLHDNVD